MKKINFNKIGRKKIRLILMIGGMVGLSFILAQLMVPPPKIIEVTKTKEVKVDLPREDILIAAKDINVGGVITNGSLKWKSVLAENVGVESITRSKQPNAQSTFDGWLVKITMLQDEPVNIKKLLDRENSGVLSHLLESGRRALSIPASPDSSAAGFILPNDRVDLITVVPNKKGKMVVKSVSKNVRVIAIDQQLESMDGQNNIQARLFTFDVLADDVDAIIKAASSGRINIILRSAADHDEKDIEKKKKNIEGISFFRAGRKTTIIPEE